MTPRRATASAASVALACVLCLHARPAIAQEPVGNDSTARLSSGIDAFVDGDYATAADRLRPLAERWPREPDPTAAFFMASMYDNGLGVVQDATRACALYARAATKVDDSPTFAQLAAATLQETWASTPPEQTAHCTLLSNLGFYHQFQPETFELGPDHWVSLELTANGRVGATVTHRGREKRTTAFATPGGARFLPLRHTELEVQGRSPGQRHFVEIAAWVPDGSSWHLTWILFEVSGPTLTQVATAVVATSEASAELDESRRDTRQWVSLDVNEQGDAQWATRDQGNARAEVIPSSDERRAEATAHEARRTAEKRVNWEKTADPERPPSFRYAAADGCADLQVLGWSADRTELVSVKLDRDQLPASGEPVMLDLSTAGTNADVAIDVFDRAQRQWPRCTDAVVVEDQRRQETWRAVGGVASVTLSEPGLRADHPQQYEATVQIQDAEFVGPTGTRVRATRAITLTAVVGPP